MYICVYIYTYMYLHMHIHVYIYIDIYVSSIMIVSVFFWGEIVRSCATCEIICLCWIRNHLSMYCDLRGTYNTSRRCIWGGFGQSDRLNHRPLLQKRLIKETIFCKRDLAFDRSC